MALKVASRADIAPFRVMEVMRAAFERDRNGQACYHMEVGQPGTGAPDGVLRAAEKALRSGKLGYTDALGIPELRNAISAHYQDFYGCAVAPDRIAVTTGSSAGFVLSFLAAFDQGDRVGLVTPGYPCYRAILQALGCEAVIIESGPEERFQPTPALLDRSIAEGGPLDGLIVASPSNPTGTMLDRAALQVLCDYCRDAGVRLISDEIYHGITYEMPAETALAVTDSAIVVNSFSKYFSMTGWRIGWMVLPEELVRPTERLAQNLFISPPSLAQVSAEAAFHCHPELQANVARYRANRDLLLANLPEIGFQRLAPSDGAFYIYADVRDLTNDSPAYCQRILNETGVAFTSGIDFDPRRGHTDLRISYAGTTEDVTAAIEALRAWKA